MIRTSFSVDVMKKHVNVTIVFMSQWTFWEQKIINIKNQNFNLKDGGWLSKTEVLQQIFTNMVDLYCDRCHRNPGLEIRKLGCRICMLTSRSSRLSFRCIYGSYLDRLWRPGVSCKTEDGFWFIGRVLSGHINSIAWPSGHGWNAS